LIYLFQIFKIIIFEIINNKNKMQKEAKKILSGEIIKKPSKLKTFIKNFLDGFFSIFYYLLKNPLDNVWWECISLIIQYIQLIILIIDETVSFLLKI
jgi:hypothetical protein